MNGRKHWLREQGLKACYLISNVISLLVTAEDLESFLIAIKCESNSTYLSINMMKTKQDNKF